MISTKSSIKKIQLSNQEQKQFLKQVQCLLKNHQQHKTSWLALSQASAGTEKTFCSQTAASGCAAQFKDEHSATIVSSTAISAQQFSHIRATAAHSWWTSPIEHSEPSLTRCESDFSDETAQNIKKKPNS